MLETIQTKIRLYILILFLIIFSSIIVSNLIQKSKRPEILKMVNRELVPTTGIITLNNTNDMQEEPFGNIQIPVGAVLPYMGGTLPEAGGWLWCDGNEIPSSDEYTQLRLIVSTRFSNDNKARTPNLNGRVPRGVVDENKVGETHGYDVINIEYKHIPRHSHSLTYSCGSNACASNNREFKTYKVPGKTVGTFEADNDNDQTGISTGSEGNKFLKFPKNTGYNNNNTSISHNNVQPTKIVNYIIKY